MPKRRVTVNDIARSSEASPTTVSLVLRNKPGISSETRDRVLAAAADLGYRPRGGTRPAPTPETAFRNVAMLLRARNRASTHLEPGVNPFYSWVMNGMQGQARKTRINLLYGHLPVDATNTLLETPMHLLDQPLAGAIIVGPFSDDTISHLVGAAEFPVVLVDAPNTPRAFDVIASDNAGGARRAVEHLISLGHRHIGLVAPFAGSDPNFAERAAGYRQAIAACGLTAYPLEPMSEPVTEPVTDLLRAEPQITALFCVNDLHAVAAIEAARHIGRSVPDSLSVIGFDNTDHPVHAGPALTTMAVDKIGMGRLAVTMLEYRIANRDAAVSCTTLMPTLLKRQTVAPVQEV